MTVPFNDLRRQEPAVAAEVDAAVARVLRSGWYSLGPEVEAFERELAAAVGVPFAVGVGNGTDALELALVAVGCGPGAEVVTAANAGGYTTTATLRAGGTPVYADVDPVSLLLDPVAVAGQITPRTCAVVVTHLYGQLGPVEELAALCRDAGVSLVEDCAQAIGASRTGRAAGSFGEVAAFSFYPTKNLGAVGDGGAVVTSDPTVAERVRSLRQYGWGHRYEAATPGGRNSRLDELQAAVLRVKLPHLAGWNARRRQIRQQYREALAPAAGRLLGTGGEDDVVHLAVVVAEDRRALAARLESAGAATSVHYPVPDHRQPAYRGSFVAGPLPVTERLVGQVLSLPCFPLLTEAEVGLVSAGLR